jgi:hypothetical protein
MSETEPTWRYVVVIDPRTGAHTVVDRTTNEAVLLTYDPKRARQFQEQAEASHRRQEAQLDALARAAGRPR